MTTFRMQSDQVTLGVTSVGGHLDGVVFRIGDTSYSPLHTAPWKDAVLDASIPPMLRMLRGDFFCAPFADNDVDPAETRPHGATANDTWELAGRDVHELRLRLAKPVSGATVDKIVRVHPGHAAIYQTHRFTGGEGDLPLGHHLMVRSENALRLGFSAHVWAGTPPTPVEPDAEQGRSLLEYPQRIESLRRVKRADGAIIDVTSYPWDNGHEDILMLVTDRGQRFGWTAVTDADAGWVLFALKRPEQLASTMIWMSNGGRTYAPWNGTHTRVLGLEEVTSYFHLGHALSIGDNEVKAAGHATSVKLSPERPTEIRYLFGLAACPSSFGRVEHIDPAPGGIKMRDEFGRLLLANVDLSFLTPGPR